MARRISIIFLIALTLATTFAESQAWAQASAPAAAEGKNELTGTRRQVATIIFAGLAGAILGLSTLSFYGRPQDKLNNVAIGGALGIIGGTVYTTYKSATRPYENYDVAADWPMNRDIVAKDFRLPIFAYGWQF